MALPPPQIVYAEGIPSAFDTSYLFIPQFVYPGTIESQAEVGEHRLGIAEYPTGIPSQVAFGQPRFLQVAYAGTYESPIYMGSPTYEYLVLAPTVPLTRGKRAATISERYSGIVINQNKIASSSVSLGNYIGSGQYSWTQEFKLPFDYTRGSINRVVPPFTGIQIFVSINQSYEDVASVSWRLDHYLKGAGWQILDEGVSIGSGASGNEVWFNIFFNEPITIDSSWTDDKFRFSIDGRNFDPDNTFKEEVPYHNGKAYLERTTIYVQLEPGIPYHFTLPNDPTPRILERDSRGIVFHSIQQGVTNWWVTAPNPLITQDGRLYKNDKTTPHLVAGEESSAMFRLLGGIAESGTDYLGNRYRSAIRQKKISNVSVLTRNDAYWMSKPNPSKFAVESLYFDVRDGFDEPSVIDKILLDPMTPGVYFHVYTSTEGEPGVREGEWDEKLWTRVPQTFEMKQRQTHVLPEPITASYIKIDFSHLQPKWYAPGNFQKPTVYKKYPKWVLDYFTIRLAASLVSEDAYISRRTALEYSLLQLAYNYYLDDLAQEPATPAELGMVEQVTAVSEFLRVRDDISDTIDLETMSRIQLELEPYTRDPTLQAKLDFILSAYARSTYNSALNDGVTVPVDNPVEVKSALFEFSTSVSQLDRDTLLTEKTFPAMFFYVPCRHRYRIVQAQFTHDRAYFAGVKDVAFLRDKYNAVSNRSAYIEAAGDSINVERNDFIVNDSNWVAYG